jgi:thiamine biosynthesis lipoprotein
MTHKQRMTRRAFLRIVGIGGVMGGAALLQSRNPQSAEALIVSETRLLMGTVVNLTLVTGDRRAGKRAIRVCLGQMAALERVLSRHQAESQLSYLNREGRLDAPNPHLVAVLREAVVISELTKGAFDVTVKPLVDLYQQHHHTYSLPSDHAVQSTLAQVGFQHLEVSEQRVAFSCSDMAITLDGIAKGYIVDQGAAVLQAHGFHDILVEAGGDLAAAGTKAQHAPWRIGIQQPRSETAHLLHAFSVQDQAVATSGDYIQPYTDDFIHHHIIDPRTGYSASALASATVTGATGMQADALATAFMVMDPEQGLELIETLPGYEAYLVTKDSQVLHSTGL